MEKQREQSETLRKNPKIDRKVVVAYERLANELRRAGVEIKSEYSISPPLGGPIPSLYGYQRK